MESTKPTYCMYNAAGIEQQHVSWEHCGHNTWWQSINHQSPGRLFLRKYSWNLKSKMKKCQIKDPYCTVVR